MIMIGNSIRKLKYILKGWKIGKNVILEKGCLLKAKSGIIGDNTYIGKNCKIIANNISIGNNCLFYSNVDILINNDFIIGNRCKISRNTLFRANSIHIGEELWCNENVEVGGGGWMKPSANLTIGNHVHIGRAATINVCESVTIGSFTGIGIECMIFTHSSGNGQSILQGYKHIEMPVQIGNNVSLFTRAFIAPGVNISDGVTVAAMAFLSCQTNPNGFYAGIPAKEKYITKPLDDDKQQKALYEALKKEIGSHILEKSVFLCDVFTKDLLNNITEFCEAIVCKNADCLTDKCAIFQIEKNLVSGKSSETTEKLRDALRRNGIMFDYSNYIPKKLDYKLFISSGIEKE